MISDDSMRFLIVRILVAVTGFSIQSAAQSPSYYNAIVPIIESKCAGCHHKGGNAPFSLQSYEDVVKRASFIEEVIQNKFMPPWKADPHYSSFANERILSDSQINLIKDWIKNGKPKGNAADFKSQANFAGGTHLQQKPDLTLKIKSSFIVKGDNKETFVVFRLPYRLKKSRNVKAIEFFSDDFKLIHHANFGFHQVDSAATKPLPGEIAYVDLMNAPQEYEQFGKLSQKIVYYSGWIPGTTYEQYPKNMGWVLPKDGMILLYLHYAPSAKDMKSNCGVNIFFTDEPVERPISVVNVGTGGKGDITPPLIIPPDSIFKVTAKIETKKDQSILFVWPHMHLLGKSFKAYALTYQGDTIPLINIPQWDFNWQDIYLFKKPIRVPPYSVVVIEAEYDNTKDNPRNPFNPPRTVTSDQNLIMKTTDEMLNLILVYTPYRSGDENISLDYLYQ